MYSDDSGLRVMVSSLIASLPGFVNVMIMIALLFIVFAVIGVQLFGGVLGYRCMDSLGMYTRPSDITHTHITSSN